MFIHGRGEKMSFYIGVDIAPKVGMNIIRYRAVMPDLVGAAPLMHDDRRR